MNDEILSVYVTFYINFHWDRIWYYFCKSRLCIFEEIIFVYFVKIEILNFKKASYVDFH